MIAHNAFSTHILCRLDVYLDGIKLYDCIWADDEEGVAWVIARDEDGKSIPAIMALPGDVCEGLSGMLSYVVVMLQGKVEIRISEPNDPQELSVEEVKRALDECKIGFPISLEWPSARRVFNTILLHHVDPLVNGQARLKGRRIGG